MNKELSFDDEDGVYLADDEDYEDDTLMNSKIPVGQFAKIIDELEAIKDDFDADAEDDIDFDSPRFH